MQITVFICTDHRILLSSVTALARDVEEDSCVQINKGLKPMDPNTNQRVVGQWVMMDNGLVWQWTAIKSDNVVKLRTDTVAQPKAA